MGLSIHPSRQLVCGMWPVYSATAANATRYNKKGTRKCGPGCLLNLTISDRTRTAAYRCTNCLVAVTLVLAASPVVATTARPAPASATATVGFVCDDPTDNKASNASGNACATAPATTAATTPTATAATTAGTATTTATALRVRARRRGDGNAKRGHGVHGHHQHDGRSPHPSSVQSLHLVSLQCLIDRPYSHVKNGKYGDDDFSKSARQ